jgi:hypothetical protein
MVRDARTARLGKHLPQKGRRPGLTHRSTNNDWLSDRVIFGVRSAYHPIGGRFLVGRLLTLLALE